MKKNQIYSSFCKKYYIYSYKFIYTKKTSFFSINRVKINLPMYKKNFYAQKIILFISIKKKQ